jgi:hypothetical protein
MWMVMMEVWGPCFERVGYMGQLHWSQNRHPQIRTQMFPYVVAFHSLHHHNHNICQSILLHCVDFFCTQLDNRVCTESKQRDFQLGLHTDCSVGADSIWTRLDSTESTRTCGAL